MTQGYRLKKHIDKFQNPGSLEQHFHLGKKMDSKIEIETYIPNNQIKTINLKIKYFKNQNIFHFPFLPKKINKHIYNFVVPTKYIIIQIEIVSKGDDDFVWKAPKFSLIKLENNIDQTSDKQIHTFLEYKIDLHNKITRENWHPAISIDKNILDLFTKINHFEELLNHST